LDEVVEADGVGLTLLAAAVAVDRRLDHVPVDRLKRLPPANAGRRAGDRRHLGEELNALARLGAFQHVSLGHVCDLMGQDHRQLCLLLPAGE
jgi:hypothetical protein